MARLTKTLALASSALLLGGCPGAPAAPSADPQAPPASEVLVTVNGEAITRDDLRHEVSRNPRTRGQVLTPEQERNLLEVMIGQEVLAQRAAELKLADAPHIQRQLARKQAEVTALRRKLLARQLAAHLATEEVEVTDAEVRAHHEANAEQVAQRFRIHQILRRRPDEIEALRARLEAGEAFETLAAEGMPALPAGAPRPWELGFLRWTQLPEPWRPVVAKLEVGETSGVISTDRRHWILKLVAKERDPEATFEHLLPSLRQDLQRIRSEERREATETSLRAKAKVVFPAGDPAPERSPRVP